MHDKAPNNATKCFGASEREGGHDPVGRGELFNDWAQESKHSPACCLVKPSRLPKGIARERPDSFRGKVTLSSKGHCF